MPNPKPVDLTLVACMDSRRGIGRFNKLPWDVPEDMDMFKQLTMGQVVVMGRATWESLPEKFRPLPGRTNVVLSRYKQDEVRRLCPPDKSVIVCEDDFSLLVGLGYLGVREAYVIGGAAVYANLIHRCGKLEITHLAGDFDCDAHFPEIPPAYALEKWTKFASRVNGLQGGFATYRKCRQDEMKARDWAHTHMKDLYLAHGALFNSAVSTAAKIKYMAGLVDAAQFNDCDIREFFLRTEGYHVEA